MFKLNNLYNSNPLEVVIDHNGVEITFIINTIVNKRNKDEIAADKQFILLEAYLDYKGEAFKTALMDKYIAAEEVLADTIGRVDIMPLPYEMIHDILDLFDINDVFNFIKNVYRYPALNSLKDEFDEKLVEDGLGTRVQTYIKDDYLELASLVQIIKCVIGPIGQFGYMNASELGKVHNNYILFNFITTHPIFDTPPFVKLYGLVTKVIESLSKTDDESAIRIIEKKIPTDELPIWALSITIMQKIALATIVDDTDSKNIVTRAYGFINNKLKVKGDVSNAIRVKKSMLDSESGDGETESILESYRIISELPKGFVVEMEWALANLRNNPQILYSDIDLEIFNSALSFTQKLNDAILSPVQITILGWIFKEVIDPRTLMYVKMETIVSLLALAFTYLWQHNFKYLALMLTSMPVSLDDVVVINFTSNRSRITKELKDELDIMFPYKKVVVATGNNKEVNLGEIAINEVADEMYKHRWSMTASTEFIYEVTKSNASAIVVPSDLKIQLAELVLFLNRK